jgi:hypothetical protein
MCILCIFPYSIRIYTTLAIYIWVYPNYIPEHVEFHFEAIAWFSYTLFVLEKMEFSSFKVRLVETWNYAYAPTLHHCIWASREFLTNRTYGVGLVEKNYSQVFSGSYFKKLVTAKITFFLGHNLNAARISFFFGRREYVRNIIGRH